MSEDKSGKAKITIEVELNEALMSAAKEWRPKMGWMGPLGGMGYGMQCPACGEPMLKPSNEQVLEMLERRKERLEAVLEHINMEIDKLKESKKEMKP